MGAIQIWLTNGTKRFRLPVNPESFQISSPFGFEDVEVAQLGEITVIGNVGQREISFSSFFPRDYNVSYCEYANIPRPWDVYNMLERWKRERKPIRLTITGTLINFEVTIREFTTDPERAGSPGDIYFTMVLKEYRNITFSKVKKTSSNTAAKSSKTARPAPPVATNQTYVVKSGDTLSKIALRYYKDASKFPVIYNANKSVIGKNPNLILPGQKLVIP